VYEICDFLGLYMLPNRQAVDDMPSVTSSEGEEIAYGLPVGEQPKIFGALLISVT